MSHASPSSVIPAKAGIPLWLTSHFFVAVAPWLKSILPSTSWASRYRGTLYVGVTSALWSRVCDHKNDTAPGFTSRYGVKLLVWYEHHQSMAAAIRREKQIKAWKRDWKFVLVEGMNPDWRDLHDSIDVTATLVEAGPQLSLG